MLPKNIPEDINVELLLSYFPQGSCKVAFKGMHKRNAYKDIISIENNKDDGLLIGIGRHSLYNSLPEQMFHPIERFGSLAKKEDQKKFSEEIEHQEKEIEKAYRFFAPLDLFLLKLRIEVRRKIGEYTENNKALLDILSDGLSDSQRKNRFVSRAIPFLPSCKTIRGNKTLITLMLRKILLDEGILLQKRLAKKTYEDCEPRYEYRIGAPLESCYVGNTYDQFITTYNVHYWSDEDCDENFLQFVADVEEFAKFIQDYFISVEEEIVFDVSTDCIALRLSDDILFNYMNYNTNI